MKRIIYFFIICIISLSVYNFRKDIAKFLAANIFLEEKKASDVTHNLYFNNRNYNFVSNTTDFVVDNKQEILNVFYTILNSGMDEFTFYCSDVYTDCVNTIDSISNDRVLLSNINNFVNPYNSFQDIETTRYESTGKVEVKITYLYDKETIKKIDDKIKEIVGSQINDTMSNTDKIKILHDYIIENTKYDSNRSDNNITNYKSNTAYGPLFEGYAICSGYSDAMSLLLNEVNIPSIKIASENHIWNLVYVDGNWYHLDLTWDDPVLSNGKEIIDYEYFLITTEELYNKNDNQHYFDKDVYKEAVN